MNTSKQELIQELDRHSVKISKAVLLYRVINNAVRLKILRHLHGKKRLTVTELYVDLEMEQCVMSQHLAILRKSGLVKTHREGKFIFYFINYLRLQELNDISESLLKASNQDEIPNQLAPTSTNSEILIA